MAVVLRNCGIKGLHLSSKCLNYTSQKKLMLHWERYNLFIFKQKHEGATHFRNKHTSALISRKILGCQNNIYIYNNIKYQGFFCLDLSHGAFFWKEGAAWLGIWQSPWNKNISRTWSLQSRRNGIRPFWQGWTHGVPTSLVGTAGVCGSKVSLRLGDWFPEPENPGAFLSAFQENTSSNSRARAAQTAVYKEEK